MYIIVFCCSILHENLKKLKDVKYFFIDKFDSNYFDTLRNLAVQFVIEFKYLRELEEKGFDKNNIVIEKKYHKLKEFIKNDIGDSIIIVENKYKITVGSSNIKNNFMNESTQDYYEPQSF